MAGAPRDGSQLLALSRTHALARWFAVRSGAKDADNALAVTLSAPISPEAYVSALGRGCAVPMDARPLGAVSVTMQGDVAIVTPGEGDPEIPGRAVAIDVRDLPETKELAAAIARVVAKASATAVSFPKEEQVLCDGMPDEIFAPGKNVYKCSVERVHALPAIEPKGASDRPIVLLTGPRIAPSAALFAAALRTSGRAFIHGENVLTAVAEHDVSPLGVALRTHVLYTLPDLVPADRRVRDPLKGLAIDGSPAPLEGDFTRERFPTLIPYGVRQPLNEQASRAALVGAHAALRTFFPYFHVVDDTIDARLGELFPLVEPDARKTAHLLGRLIQPLHDGHAWVIAYDKRARGVGYAPLEVDFLGQPRKMIVVQSQAAGIEAGDEIVAIGGAPVEPLIKEALARVSAGSEITKLSFAAGKVLELDGPTEIAVKRPGIETTAKVTPVATPPSGRFLGGKAHGLPDQLYYVNLDAEATATMDIAATVAAAHASKGIVLDMRGYPGPASWELIANLIPGKTEGPKLLAPRFTRRGEKDRPEMVQRLDTFAFGTHAPYTGPIAVLVGPHSQSQSEHLISFLVNGKAKLVGRPTSGANGNITGAQLAGGFAVTFTGMEVRHTDGRRFHGIGHVPDVVAEPTAEDLRSGKDTVLEAAIAAIR
jgi:hypothetical protein